MSDCFASAFDCGDQALCLIGSSAWENFAMCSWQYGDSEAKSRPAPTCQAIQDGREAQYSRGERVNLPAEPYLSPIFRFRSGSTTDLLWCMAQLGSMPCRAFERFPVQPSTPQDLVRSSSEAHLLSTALSHDHIVRLNARGFRNTPHSGMGSHCIFARW
jgi:hypothetical protein